MKISLLTRRPGRLDRDFFREKIRAISGRKSGPMAVLESLRRGLAARGVVFSVNNRIFETVHVISGVRALKYALKLKRAGIIKTLIVGPAIVVFPDDADKIILDKNIDVIVFPSLWTKDFFCSRYPELKDKIEIWPAGVADPGEPKAKNGSVLIFYKNNQGLLKGIVEFLKGKIKYDIIEYGRFKQADYNKSLNDHQYLVYLSDSESQGIALQEAWVRNIPSFVWNRGYWQVGGAKWPDAKISAPYLDEASGWFFKDLPDFKNKFFDFMAHDFSPRKYCLANLSDKKSTEIFMKIIKKYDKQDII